MMRRNINFHSVKHIPQRTCLACRKVRAKQELVRLVRLSDGSVEVDIGAKRTGRGAYLCPTAECWKVGLKGSRVERTLRATLTQDNRGRLIKYGESLLQGVN